MVQPNRYKTFFLGQVDEGLGHLSQQTGVCDGATPESWPHSGLTSQHNAILKF